MIRVISNLRNQIWILAGFCTEILCHEESGPNIILILADDQGFADVDRLWELLVGAKTN